MARTSSFSCWILSCSIRFYSIFNLAATSSFYIWSFILDMDWRMFSSCLAYSFLRLILRFYIFFPLLLKLLEARGFFISWHFESLLKLVFFLILDWLFLIEALLARKLNNRSQLFLFRHFLLSLAMGLLLGEHFALTDGFLNALFLGHFASHLGLRAHKV